MNTKGIEEAIAAARRFLAQAETVISLHKMDDTYIFGSRDSATLRRKSMDLTRALADMRKFP